MLIKVNCHVPPEHSPKDVCWLSYRRATFTESRLFDNTRDALLFVENVEKSGQLELLRSVLIKTVAPKPLNQTEALTTKEMVRERRDENSRANHRYFRTRERAFRPYENPYSFGEDDS